MFASANLLPVGFLAHGEVGLVVNFSKYHCIIFGLRIQILQGTPQHALEGHEDLHWIISLDLPYRLFNDCTSRNPNLR